MAKFAGLRHQASSRVAARPATLYWDCHVAA